MAIWSRVTGGVAAFGIGAAAADAIEPELETTKQQAWAERAVKVVDPGTAALAKARHADEDDVFRSLDGEGGIVKASTFGASPVDFAEDAKRQGVGVHRFGLLRRLATTVPPYPEALKLWRRGRIDVDTVDTILRREAIPEGLWPALKELADERLNIADVANAIQQDFIPDPPPSHPNDPVLPGTTPPTPDWTTASGPFDIPRKVVPIDSAKEAKAEGINYERLRVLAELVGLPPGEETLIELWRRGIIDSKGYAQGLREGHTKTKWTAALSARFYQLLPAGVVVRLRLKGWIDDNEFHARMKRHGYRDTAADDWFHSEGRPATTHQAVIGTRRGGTYDNAQTEAADYFKKAVLQSDIRNEWIDILWHGRETYPSAFVLRRLTEDGDITQAQAHDILYQSAWPEWLAAQVSTSWAGGAGAVSDPNVKKAQTQLWTATHRSYIAGEADEATVQGRLGQLGIPEPAQLDILTLWGSERGLVRKQLSASDVRKAYQQPDINAATGQPWTRDEALAALLDRGWGSDDANSYLDIPYKG